MPRSSGMPSGKLIPNTPSFCVSKSGLENDREVAETGAVAQCDSLGWWHCVDPVGRNPTGLCLALSHVCLDLATLGGFPGLSGCTLRAGEV